MSSMLTDRSRSLLEKAGWHSGRQIDISALEESLTGDEYEVFPIVRDFLTEFGKLRITFPFDSEGRRTTTLYLDPTVDIVPHAKEHSMQRFRQHVGQPICAIGAYENETLVMDPEGKVYLGDGDYVDLIGKTGLEAIENILQGKDITSYNRIAAPEPEYREGAP